MRVVCIENEAGNHGEGLPWRETWKLKREGTALSVFICSNQFISRSWEFKENATLVQYDSTLREYS